MPCTAIEVAGPASTGQDSIESRLYTRLDTLRIGALNSLPPRKEHGETWETQPGAHGVQSHFGLLYNHGFRLLEPISVVRFASIHHWYESLSARANQSNGR